MKRFAAYAFSTSILVLPGVVLAQSNTPRTFKDLVGMLVELLNSGTAVLVTLAVVVFLFGAAQNMLKARTEGGAALRNFLLWGVIILFVMVSIWGILRLLQATLFSSNGASGGAQQTNTQPNFQTFAP